jgi:hypothetical protein
MANYPSYRERGLPGVQEREVRAVHCARIDGAHTVAEYLNLVRSGELPPLRYESLSVPPVECRHCERLRLDDGTRCYFCGAYQHCAIVTPYAGRKAAAAVPFPVAATKTGNSGGKPVNPRRRKTK